MKIKTERAPNPNKRGRMVALKLNEAEYSAIEKKAKKYADGNISAFLRYAGIHFEPKP